MRVLQVSCNGLGNGGVQAVLMGIVKNISSAQFDIILFNNEKGFYDEVFISLGGKIYRILNYSGKSGLRKKLDSVIKLFRIFNQTYSILKKNGPYDAIHCHNDWISGVCLLAAYLAGVKVRITHSHRSDYEENNGTYLYLLKIYKKLLQFLLLSFSNIKIACSQKAAQSLYGQNCLKRNDVRVIFNCIDLNKFSKENYIKIENETINILHVGQYCLNKNQSFIIELIPYIRKYFNEFKINLIGNNDQYKKLLIRQCINLGIENYVEFIDGNRNVAELLAMGDIFIFPSLSEGFGLALLEAQAMGLLCIVSDSISNDLDMGLCEFVSLKTSKEKWAEMIVKMLENREKYQIDHVKLEQFNLNNYIQKFKEIYMGK